MTLQGTRSFECGSIKNFHLFLAKLIVPEVQFGFMPEVKVVLIRREKNSYLQQHHSERNRQ